MNIKTGVHFPKISSAVQRIGREFRKIQDNRAKVEAFRKEIDEKFGLGIGARLISPVLGCNLNLTKIQIGRLEKVAEFGPPPRGLKQDFDRDSLKWVASYKLESKLLGKMKTEMTSYIQDVFCGKRIERRLGTILNAPIVKETMDVEGKPTKIVEDVKVDLSKRPDVGIMKVLKYFVGGEEILARNLSALLTEKVVNILDKRISSQICSQLGFKFVEGECSGTCTVKMHSDHYEISYEYTKLITELKLPGGRSVPVDSNFSTVKLKIPSIRVSHAHFAAGEIEAGLKFAGAPEISFEVFPVPKPATLT